MRGHISLLFVVALALALVTMPAAEAQVQTGSILIKVTDQQGNIVPGVALTISSSVLVTPYSGMTEAGGAFRQPGLPPGVYTLKAELQGFQTFVRENVVVSVGQTTSIDVALDVASVEETVTVTAESPVVDTTSTNVHVMLSEQLLQKTPGGRDIWSLLEYKVPGLVTARPDVGGAAGGLQGAFSARGTPNSQNIHFLNGINVGDPAAIGFTQFYYDYDAFEEIQVSTGSHDLSVPAAGVFLNMVTKTGGEKIAGKASLAYQSEGTQGSNVDQELLNFGLRPDAGAVDYISDVNFQIGGPIIADKLRFFGSFRDWRVHVNVPGFPEIEETNITSGIGNFTYQVNDRNRVTAFVSRQYYKKPNRGASALNTPQSNFNEDDVTAIYQALWNSTFSNNAFMDARVSYNDLFFPLYIKAPGQSLLDSATNFRERSAATESLFTRRRLQASANFQYYVDHALGGRHELRFGIDHAHAPTKTTQNRNFDVNLTHRSGRAQEVELFNSTVNSKATVDVTALFFQDSYSLKNLTINAGIRFEALEGYLPEQSSPPSRWFPNAQRSFDAIHDVPNWKDVAPRVGVVYDLFGDGKTALKASYGRYLYTLSTGTPNSVNPNFSASRIHQWNDANGDLIFQPGEEGALLRVTGGLITSMDPDIKRPRTDEFSVSVDHELFPDFRLSAAFGYRKEKEQFGNHDVGVPFSAYRLVTRPDVSRDGLAGTADDSTIQVWDQDPATRGQNRIVITNNDLLEQTSKGFEITATKRFSKKWLLLAGYTVGKATIITNAVQNPNQLINNSGPIDLSRTHVFKMTGSYLLPYDVAFSGNLRAQSGPFVTRTVRYALTQGNVTLNAEPRGNEKLDALTTIDLRATKSFTLGGRELEIMMDIYNLANVNTTWDVRTLTGRVNVRPGGDPNAAVVNQQQYLSPTGIIGPRIVRFSAAYRF